MSRANRTPAAGSEPIGIPGGALATQPQMATSITVIGNWTATRNLRNTGRRPSIAIKTPKMMSTAQRSVKRVSINVVTPRITSVARRAAGGTLDIGRISELEVFGEGWSAKTGKEIARDCANKPDGEEGFGNFVGGGIANH